MSRRRERSRANRKKIKTLPKVVFRPIQNPYTPYNMLTEAQIMQLHNASMHILENVGLDFLDAESLSIWEKAGAKVDHAARHVWIDRGLIEQTLATTPSQFTWLARNPVHNTLIGHNHIACGPCGGMVYAHDRDNGRRPGVFADYENLVRLTQMSPQLHFGPWEQVAIHDVPISFRHLENLRAGIFLTDKAMMAAAHGRIITADNIALAKIAFGGAALGGKLPDDPIMGDVINVNSPLTFDDRMLGGLITYARAGQATYITPFILAGAMSPVTMAAAFAQQNAEALAGIALTQLVRPGAPVIYGGFTTNTDLKSGSPAFGTPEGAWALLVGGQLARHYGLPYRGSGSLTNAVVPDAQAAYESQWNLWPCVLAHTNLIMHAVGWMEGGLTASFEKFVIDAENLAMFAKFLQGFEISAETLALDMIAQVGPGGHHFGTQHTIERYRDAFHKSPIANRFGYDAWQQRGSEDTYKRANALWKKQLAEYEQPPLDPAIRDAVNDYVERRKRELEGVDLYD